jgi:hypothetical protein
MIWARMLAYITGTVDQELLLRNEYLAEENRILRARVKGRLLLSGAEKATWAEIAHRLWRKALAELASAAQPDALFRWYRDLIAKKFDGSRFRKSRGRPPLDEEIERLVVRIAGGIRAGDMTGSWELWPTWATRFPIRPSAISLSGMTFRQRRSENKTQAGRTSSALTWPSWWERTSSRSKCLRARDC